MSETLHIYTRVSTDSQEQFGSSLETQREEGLKKAKELGMVPKVWNEGGESSRHDDFKNRPIFTQLLLAIDTGEVKHLWVYNPDRLARSDMAGAVIRHKLRGAGVTLYTATANYSLSNEHDKMILGLQSLIGSYDNALRAERTRIGKLKRVKEGQWHGGPPPYGYKVVGKKLVVEKEEAKWVKFIFESYRDGRTVNDIKRLLIQHVVPTRRQKHKWSGASITSLLSNTHYVGHYSFRDKKSGETVTSQCEAIISQDLVREVAEAKKKRSARRVRESSQKHFYLLRDFLVCGHCDSRFSGRIYPKQYRSVYYCPRKERNHGSTEKNSTKKCSNSRYLKIAETDDLIWNTVIEVLSKSDLFKSHFKEKIFTEKQSYGERQREAKRLGKKLRDIDREIESFSLALANAQSGNTTTDRSAEQVAKATHTINGLILDLQEQKQQLVAQIQEKRAEIKWVDWLKEYQDDLAKKKELKGEDRRKVLENVIKSITVKTVDTRSHRLTITFKLPYLGAKFHYFDPKARSKGGTITGGTETVEIPVNDDAKKNT